MIRAEVDEQSLVHPLATGSEAYYTFESGDSVLMTLPDGKRLAIIPMDDTVRILDSGGSAR